MNYPAAYGRCVVCGAGRNEFCTVISGGEVPGDQRTFPERHREVPHHYRSRIGENEPPEGSVAVKDEPNHYRGQPHTVQCEERCPL